MTITVLTIRQFLRSRQLLIVAVIMLIPVLLAFIPRIAGENNSTRDLQDIAAEILFLNLTASTLLPLAVMVIATAAFSDEIDDKTLQYLTLKPMSRFSIVFQKTLAVLLVLVPICGVFVAAAWGVQAWGHMDILQDMLDRKSVV